MLWRSETLVLFIPCHYASTRLVDMLQYMTRKKSSQHGVARQFLLAHLLMFIKFGGLFNPSFVLKHEASSFTLSGLQQYM